MSQYTGAVLCVLALGPKQSDTICSEELAPVVPYTHVHTGRNQVSPMNNVYSAY